MVGLTAEDLLVGEVRRHRGDALNGCRDGLAAGERLIAERADQHYVLGENTGESIFVRAAVHAVDKGLDGGTVPAECGHGGTRGIPVCGQMAVVPPSVTSSRPLT